MSSTNPIKVLWNEQFSLTNENTCFINNARRQYSALAVKRPSVNGERND